MSRPPTDHGSRDPDPSPAGPLWARNSSGPSELSTSCRNPFGRGLKVGHPKPGFEGGRERGSAPIHRVRPSRNDRDPMVSQSVRGESHQRNGTERFLKPIGAPNATSRLTGSAKDDAQRFAQYANRGRGVVVAGNHERP